MSVSSLRIRGVVRGVVEVPDTPHLLFVIEDAASAKSAEETTTHVSNRHGHAALLKNMILLLLDGDWSLSCSFVRVGDQLEMSRFQVDIAGFDESLPSLLPASSPLQLRRSVAAGKGISNAPRLVDFAESQTHLGLPATTLCVRPCGATELIVIRLKRVVINFANVGKLALMDVTEKEQRSMETDFVLRADKSKTLQGLSPPRHHIRDVIPSTVAGPSTTEGMPMNGRIRTLQPSVTAHGSAAKGALTLLTSGFSTPSSLVTATESSVGVAGKNCYASMDRYFDVVFGQSAKINHEIAFLERIIGGRGPVLDAGCGSGLYAFTLRALGFTAITCVEKSLPMLRMLEEKNAFFELAEADMPRSHKKGRLRCIAGDITSFSLSTINAGSGEVNFEDFRVALCLNVLSHLPDVRSVESALQCLSLHTCVGGKLVVSIPNWDVVLRKSHHQRHQRFVVDRASTGMCAGATTAMPNGVVDVVVQVTIREPPNSRHSADVSSVNPLRRGFDITSDGFSRRETTIHGHACHPQAADVDGSMFVTFREEITELLLPPSVFEDLCSRSGFDVDGLYGTLAGAPFAADTSEERVYVCRRREDHFSGVN